MRIQILTAAALVGLFASSSTFAQSNGPSPQGRAPQIASIAAPDLAAWRSAEAANEKDAYLGYLRKFPTGWFSPFAKARIEAGLPMPLPTAPIYDPSKAQEAFVAAQKAYDLELWQLAQSVGTQRAMAQYLMTIRSGEFRQQATENYLRLAPVMPTGIAPDCSPEELKPRRTVDFDYARAYPARAIDRGLTDTVRGKALLHETGVILAWVDTFYTQPTFFAASTERAVLRMRYGAMRAGCVATPILQNLSIAYRLEDDGPTLDSRTTPSAVDQTIVLDRPTTLQMPEDRALLVEIPHDGSDAIYEVRATERFRTALSYSIGNRNWQPMFNGTHLDAKGTGQLRLRLSEEVAPPSRSLLRIAPKPASGPVEVVVRRVFSRPLED